MWPWTAGPQFSGRHQEEINCLQSGPLSPPGYHLGIPSAGFRCKTMDPEAGEITSFVLEMRFPSFLFSPTTTIIGGT